MQITSAQLPEHEDSTIAVCTASNAVIVVDPVSHEQDVPVPAALYAGRLGEHIRDELDLQSSIELHTALANSIAGTADVAGQRYDAILLDIDHSPNNVLDASHAAFYSLEGLRRLADHLRPGGVFALWSDDPPDDAFTATLGGVFAAAQARVVSFANPYGGEAANTLYVAKRA